MDQIKKTIQADAEALKNARTGLKEWGRASETEKEDLRKSAELLKTWSRADQHSALKSWAKGKTAVALFLKEGDPGLRSMLFSDAQVFPSFEKAATFRAGCMGNPVRGLRRAFDLSSDDLSRLVLASDSERRRICLSWLGDRRDNVRLALRTVRMQQNRLGQLMLLHGGMRPEDALRQAVSAAEARLQSAKASLEQALTREDVHPKMVRHRFEGLQPMSAATTQLVRDASRPSLIERLEAGSLRVRCLRSMRYGSSVLQAVKGKSAFTIDGGAELSCARIILGPSKLTFVQSNGDTLEVPRDSIMQVETYDADLTSFRIRKSGGVSISAPRHHLVLSHAPTTKKGEESGPVRRPTLRSSTGIWPLSPLGSRTFWAWRPRRLHLATSRDEDDRRTLFQVLQDVLSTAIADNSAAANRQSSDRARFPLAFKPYVGPHLLEPVYLSAAEAKYVQSRPGNKISVAAS